MLIPIFNVCVFLCVAFVKELEDEVDWKDTE